MKKKTVVLIAISVILISTLSLNLSHTAFAQGVSPSTSKSSSSGTSNNGATGAGTTSSTESESSLVLSPNSGPAGTTFSVHVSLFYHDTGVLIYNPFTKSHILENTDHFGSFVTTITVPKGTIPGQYHVTMSGTTGSKSFVYGHQVFLDEIFTVTGQDSKTNVNLNHPNPLPPPPPPPPKPPQPSTTPTNTGSGGGTSGVPSITITPTSGYPGTEVKITGSNFEGTATLSAGGKEVTKSSDVGGFGDFISVGSDGSLKGQVTIPSDAQPGPFTIQIDSVGPTAKATFTVLKKSAVVPVPTTPGVQDHSTQQGQQGIKSSTTSTTTGGVTLPKPTPPSGKIKLPIPYNSSSIIIPKTPVLKSCPVNSVAINKQCVSKGKVVGLLQ